MAEFKINKGVGSSVEFKGLKAQYLFLLVAAVLGLFLAVVFLTMMGVDQVVCIIVGVVLSIALIWAIFQLNDTYGEHGIMKRQARGYRPRYLINRSRVHKLLKQKRR
ncbi:MAG: DUF4133 domain-containing protein [Rikenellaceae bacterium]